jgi:hypothetical protein
MGMLIDLHFLLPKNGNRWRYDCYSGRISENISGLL